MSNIIACFKMSSANKIFCAKVVKPIRCYSHCSNSRRAVVRRRKVCLFDAILKDAFWDNAESYHYWTLTSVPTSWIKAMVSEFYFPFSILAFCLRQALIEYSKEMSSLWFETALPDNNNSDETYEYMRTKNFCHLNRRDEDKTKLKSTPALYVDKQSSVARN